MRHIQPFRVPRRCGCAAAQRRALPPFDVFRTTTFAVLDVAPMQRAVWDTRARYTYVRSGLVDVLKLPLLVVIATSKVWKRPPLDRRRWIAIF